MKVLGVCCAGQFLQSLGVQDRGICRSPACACSQGGKEAQLFLSSGQARCWHCVVAVDDSGSGAYCLGKQLPGIDPRIVDREMKNNSANRLLNPDGQFEQPLSHRGHLCRRELRSFGSSAHFLHEDVSGCRHEDTKLIGQETRAAGPVDFQPVMEFLDSVFGITSTAVNLVDGFGLERNVGDYETVIVPGITTRTSDHLGLDFEAMVLVSQTKVPTQRPWSKPLRPFSLSCRPWSQRR